MKEVFGEEASDKEVSREMKPHEVGEEARRERNERKKEER